MCAFLLRAPFQTIVAHQPARKVRMQEYYECTIVNSEVLPDSHGPTSKNEGSWVDACFLYRYVCSRIGRSIAIKKVTPTVSGVG